MRRSVPSFCNVLVASVLLLVSRVSKETSQRLVLPRSKLDLSLKCQMQCLEKVRERLLGETIRVVRKLTNFSAAIANVSDSIIFAYPHRKKLYSSFRNESRTQPMSIHRDRHHSPQAGLVHPSVTSRLPHWYALQTDSNFLKNWSSLTEKNKLARGSLSVKAKRRRASKKNLRASESSSCKPVAACCSG